MSGNGERPNVREILGGLKRFQRETVEHIFRRMYTDTDKTPRFLLADEVGLGKTRVAQGLIARIVEHLWEDVPRIDVIYICSNAAIARQNVSHLNIMRGNGFNLATRITLLPAHLPSLKANRVNFVSLTPGTSFNLRSQLGTVEERALLYWLLRQLWGDHGAGAKNLLQGHAGKQTFRENLEWYRTHWQARMGSKRRVADGDLAAGFAGELAQRIEDARAAGRPDIRSRFEEMCVDYRRPHPRLNGERAALVGELREILAASCIHALEPDLVILDEFQRFKHLLDGTDAASILAQRLFSWGDTRVLLMSATPYKMLTLDHEEDGEDHYRDFLATLDFLHRDPSECVRQRMGNGRRVALHPRTAQCEHLLQECRRTLLTLGDESDPVASAKSRLERRLRRVMSRTERLAVTEDRNGMVETTLSEGALRAEDVLAYAQLQRVADQIGHGETVEYWKSAPYLLNFMDDYHLKRCLDESSDDPALAALLREAEALLLDPATVERYRRVDPRNTRLRALMADTLGRGAARLLWVPPALPYYQPAGVFAELGVLGFTKRLVFSSWQVVPKVIACLLSYEAERILFPNGTRNTAEARRRRARLLDFRLDRGRPATMPILGMVYPCITLACRCDPLAEPVKGAQGLPTRDEAVARAERHICRLLRELPEFRQAQGREDDAWYWAAPILLDRGHYPEASRAWWNGVMQRWGLPGSEGEEPAAWREHIARAAGLGEGDALGRPPEDLVRVLAQMALGAPGVVTLRSLARVCGEPRAAMEDADVRGVAGTLANAFRTQFNLPEVTAFLRRGGSEDSYWRLVLGYCVDGCLQSVVDEYAHMLRDLETGRGAGPAETARQVAEIMQEALMLHTASLRVDLVRAEDGRVDLDRMAMRARFAVRFGDERTSEDSGVMRQESVRRAFNSPFWPFVLASTSIGQEGLDFHPYCHAIVHWNLPGNPVDLEQREGRVHRYKGHAVRKNLARRYGLPRCRDGQDPWQELFARGSRAAGASTRDLEPFWVCECEGGDRIQRHVLAQPLSRDAEHFESLRRSLSVYRMAFGQPRQEDLLQYLMEHFGAEEAIRIAQRWIIDLGPRRR